MTTTEIAVVDPENSWRSRLSWRALFAGLFAATSIHFLLWMLGAGLGFAAFSPASNDDPLASLGKGALVIQGLGAVISLWVGGWIAGRFTPLHTRATGALHGFLVWCICMIAGALTVALGAGWTVGGVARLAGSGVAAVGQPAAEAVGEVVKAAAERSTQTIKSYVDEAVAGERPTGRTGATIRAEREISFALTRLLRDDQPDAEQARAAAIRALDDNTPLSNAEATAQVDEWISDYRELKAELATLQARAEATAKEKAEKAANALAAMGILSFFAFLIGAISAIFGGKFGAKCATRREAVIVVR